MNFPDKRILRITFSLLLVVCAGLTSSGMAPPTGWFKAGTDPAGYISGTDAKGGHDGGSAAYIEADSPEDKKFGTIMQSFSAMDYLNQRMRLSAMIKTDKVVNRCLLWMRVDGSDGKTTVAFDNMDDRPIVGTTDWQRYAIVLDIPEGAAQISFGIILEGQGKAWFDDVQFEEVGPDVPVTDKVGNKSRRKPANLDFED